MRRVFGGLLFLICCGSFCLGGCASIFARNEEDATPTPAAQEIVPQRGGDLFIAIPDDITSFDPLAASDEDLVNFFELIYESPFAYDETGRLHEVLVESWEVSPDGRTYTFKIRDDVYFSDGTKMTARDVYDSARRALEAEPDMQMAPVPETTPGTSDDPSAAPVPTRQASAQSYAGRFSRYGSQITDIDLEDDAVIIRTNGPGSNVLRFMTFPVTKSNFSASEKPVGTGPYSVSGEWEPGEQVTLEVNRSRQQDLPYIERVVGVPASGQREKIDMQQTSLLDLITTNALNAGNYAISGKSMVIDYMTNYFDCLVPNLDLSSLGSAEVRHAISEAIDRRELLSTILLNHGVPSDLPIAPDSFVMDARFRSNQTDINAALQLLGQAGYRTEKDGEGRVLSLTLIVPDAIDSTYKKEAARAISKQLAAVFIEVTVEELQEGEFQQRLAAGDFDLAYCSYYLGTVPDLAFMLTQNGSGNYNGFNDTQLDQALEDCAAAITEEEMVEAFARLQELLNAHLPVIGLYFRMNSVICDEGIGGIKGIREETMYSDIQSWYTMYTTRSMGSTPMPSPTATRDRQTEPENYTGTTHAQQTASYSSAADGAD